MNAISGFSALAEIAQIHGPLPVPSATPPLASDQAKAKIFNLGKRFAVESPRLRNPQDIHQVARWCMLT